MSEVNTNMNSFLETDIGKQFVDAIQTIMTISEDVLTDEGMAAIKEKISESFNTSVLTNVKSELIRSFELNGSTRKDAIISIQTAKDSVLDYIAELQPSIKKEELINSIFDPIFKVFDEVAECYHIYDFELPILLEEDAMLPKYAHEDDAAADLFAQKDMVIPAHSISNMIPTGVHIQLPEGWCAKIWPRSSMGLKTGLRLSNSAGIIDTSYRGQLGVIYDNISDSDYIVHKGDRIAQMTIEPVFRFKPRQVDILSETERGEGGFGSTGK